MKSGRPKKKYRLKKRDWELLKHIARYGLTTFEALRKQSFFEDCGEHAIENALRTLRKHGYIKSEPLYAHHRYFRLTRKSTSLLELHPKSAKPLTAGTLPRAFAVLRYCCCIGEPKERLTSEEFQRLFPGFYKKGMPISYCVERQDGVSKLCYLRVDQGGTGRWDRLLEYCRRDILKRAEIPAFNTFIQSGRFHVVVLTALGQKAEQISFAVRDLDRELPAPVQPVVIPELINLIVPIPMDR